MTTRDPLSGDRWRVTVAVIAALLCWSIFNGVSQGAAAVWAGEIAVGGGQ